MVVLNCPLGRVHNQLINCHHEFNRLTESQTIDGQAIWKGKEMLRTDSLGQETIFAIHFRMYTGKINQHQCLISRFSSILLKISSKSVNSSLF